MKPVLAFLAAVLVGAPASASTTEPPSGTPPPCAAEMAANPAVPWSYLFWDDVPEALQISMDPIVRAALGSLQAFPPPGDHLFHWLGPRALPAQKKEVVFVFTTFPTVAAMPVGRSLSVDGDAGTLLLGEPGNVQVLVFLFVDRIFYDFGGFFERPDGYTRLLVALAHETYGNVQQFLELDLTKVETKQSLRHRFEMEIGAFRAGIRFVEAFQALLRKRPMDGRLPTHMQWALDRERLGLAVWQRRLDALPVAEP